MGVVRICKNSADTLTSLFYILGYRPPFETNPVGEVQKFHGCFNVQNSAILITYSERDAQNFGAT
jgi:hypothetical protein